MSQALADYTHALRRHWRWVAWTLLAAVALAIVALLVSPPAYRAEATVFVRTPGDVSRAVDGGDYYARQRATTYAELAQNGGLAERVAADPALAGTDITSASVTASVRPDTVLIDIAVLDSDAERAQRTAASYVRALSAEVTELESTPGTLVPRADLVVVQSPGVPTRLTWMGLPVPIVLLGAALGGAFVGAVVAVLRSLFDHELHDRRDVERIAGFPVLGPIHDENSARLVSRTAVGALPPDHGRVLLLAAPRRTAVTSLVARAFVQGLPGSDEENVLVEGFDQRDLSRHVEDLRTGHTNVVVCCAPVLSSGFVDRFTDQADAMLLVVTLGETTDDELRRACAMLPNRSSTMIVLADPNHLPPVPDPIESEALTTDAKAEA